MAFNATFNNILVISWWSVLLVECPDKTTDLSQVTDKLYDIILHRALLTCAGFELTTSLVVGSDCIGSFKSSYHTARPARFSKKSLWPDVGEITKMSVKFEKNAVLTPRNVREKSNTVIYYKTPTLTIKRREIKKWDINLYLYICMFLRLSFLII